LKNISRKKKKKNVDPYNPDRHGGGFISTDDCIASINYERNGTGREFSPFSFFPSVLYHISSLLLLLFIFSLLVT
jgi:hypothetical protein